mgnify:CR=1 FL=1
MKMVKIVAPRVEVLTPLDGETILKHIELCLLYTSDAADE